MGESILLKIKKKEKNEKRNREFSRIISEFASSSSHLIIYNFSDTASQLMNE